MRNKKVLLIVQAALIAAIYVVLTYFISAFNLASGAIQVRISEALTILPVFTPAAIPGLFIGCLLSNLLTGCMPLDVVFGSLATLIGACGTYALRKHKWLAPLPPIVANTIIVPFVLAYVYMAEGTIPFFLISRISSTVFARIPAAPPSYAALAIRPIINDECKGSSSSA